jgi:TatD DNase family protein
VPDDRLLAESDSPYLAPVPHRGKRNEPAWVSLTVARLAVVRDVAPDVLGRQVTENARRLFAVP